MDNIHLELRKLPTNIKNGLTQTKVKLIAHVANLKTLNKSKIKDKYEILFDEYERLKTEANNRLAKLNEDKK